MNSDTTSVSITPAKINYGFTMEVLPRILDHGRLLMMFTMTLTELEEMGVATGGGEDSPPQLFFNCGVVVYNKYLSYEIIF